MCTSIGRKRDRIKGIELDVANIDLSNRLSKVTNSLCFFIV